MICDLTEKDGKPDWCERHRRYHVGRELHWAKNTSAKGEQYRQLWDRQLKTTGGKPADARPFRPCGCRK